MFSKRILAFSSSRFRNSGYLENAATVIKEFIGSKQTKIAFIPFADANEKYHEYVLLVKAALKNISADIQLVLPENAESVIEKCEVIMVGGGNTFKLLHDLHKLNLLNLIHTKVNAGTTYIGWSAGSNILSPTIGTTNDMPIIEPQSFNGLGLFPFQINPHYFTQKTEGFNGETRDQRLEEFMTMNSKATIIGLPEGSWLHLENNNLKYFGKDAGVLFYPVKTEAGFIKKEIEGETDLSFLL